MSTTDELQNAAPAKLVVEGITKSFTTERGTLKALDNVSLTVGEGEFVCLVGPSGCGKSTLLNLIGLLDAPTKGTVQINGAPIASYRDRALAAVRNKELGFVFQTFHLISDLSVLDNVQIPLLYRKLSNVERRKSSPLANQRCDNGSNNTRGSETSISGANESPPALQNARSVLDATTSPEIFS